MLYHQRIGWHRRRRNLGRGVDSDPFEDLDEVDGDDQLYYADHFERQLAEIVPECFENIFGESDGEDFYGF